MKKIEMTVTAFILLGMSMVFMFWYLNWRINQVYELNRFHTEQVIAENILAEVIKAVKGAL